MFDDHGDHLEFRRAAPDAGRQRRAMLLGSVPGVLLGGLVLLLSALHPSALALAPAPVVIGVLGVISAFLATQRPMTVARLDATSFRAADLHISFRPGNPLILQGNATRRTADLILDGNPTPITEWTHLHVERPGSWDLEGVRAFARRAAEITGLHLDDQLGSREVWELAAARRRQHAEKKAFREGRDFGPHQEATPIAPLLETTLDHVLVRVPEGRPMVVIGTRTMSYTHAQPVKLTRNALAVGARSEPWEKITSFDVKFSRSRTEHGFIVSGVVVAQVAGRPWQLLTRPVQVGKRDSEMMRKQVCPAGYLHGLAQHLEECRAQAVAEPQAGREAVPEALRKLRTRE